MGRARIRGESGDLPSVQKLWTEILGRLAKDARPEHLRSIDDVLNTLCVSERLLNAEEVHGSLKFDPDNFTWGRCQYIDRLEMWSRMPALLELVGQARMEDGSNRDWTHCLGFVHPSLRQFLLESKLHSPALSVFSVEEIKAQRMIAKKCLAQLRRYDRSGYTSKYGWIAYAGTYWHKHVKKLELAGKPAPQCSDLLSSSAPSFPHWTYMTRRDVDIDNEKDGDFGIKETYPSPLYYAALLGLQGAATALIEDDADPNVECGRHKSPILAAIANQEDRLVNLLLEHGADPNTQNRDSGDSALMRAAESGNLRITKLLLAKGGNVDHQNRRRVTAMHYAVERGKPGCLAALLSAEPSLNVVDNAGDTLLHWAARTGTPTALEFLIDKEGKSLLKASNYSRQTALHIAVLCNRPANTILLLDNGADLEARDSGDQTPLCIAARKSAEDIVRILLDRGANVNAYSNLGHTALHFSLEEGNFNVAKILFEHGAKINPKEIEGEYALLAAAHASDLDMIRLLVEHGVDPDARTADGHTALDIAVLNENYDILKCLVEHGARADMMSDIEYGPTALHQAIRQQDFTTVKLLVDRGANVNARE